MTHDPVATHTVRGRCPAMEPVASAASGVSVPATACISGIAVHGQRRGEVLLFTSRQFTGGGGLSVLHLPTGIRLDHLDRHLAQRQVDAWIAQPPHPLAAPIPARPYRQRADVEDIDLGPGAFPPFT